jgi:hypothetical protein
MTADGGERYSSIFLMQTFHDSLLDRACIMRKARKAEADYVNLDRDAPMDRFLHPEALEGAAA